MNKTKLYLAGQLFKISDQKQRIEEKKLITKAVAGKLDVFSPLEDNPANDKSKLPTASSIFKGDTKEVLESKYIFAELDGEDSGVAMELGIVWGINYMHNELQTMLDNESNVTDLKAGIEKMLADIPKKKVFAHLTDLRVPTSGEYHSHHVPFGINQFLVGGVEEMGEIFFSVEEAIEELKKYL